MNRTTSNQKKISKPKPQLATTLRTSKRNIASKNATKKTAQKQQPRQPQQQSSPNTSKLPLFHSNTALFSTSLVQNRINTNTMSTLSQQTRIMKNIFHSQNAQFSSLSSQFVSFSPQSPSNNAQMTRFDNNTNMTLSLPLLSSFVSKQPPHNIKNAPRRLFSTHPTTDQLQEQEQEQTNESTTLTPEFEKKFKRMMFQATQRGWLELDLIFTAYVQTHKTKLMNEENLQFLSDVCDTDNSDLVRWFVEGRPLPDEWKSNPIMVDMLDYALQPSKPWYPKAGNQ